MTQRNLSPEAFRQMFAQEQTDQFLLCLTLSHDSLATPIRLVRNSVAIERSGATFLACYFDLNLPEDSTDGPPQVQLVIDNVNKAIAQAIRTVTGRVKASLEIVLASQPELVEVGPIDMFLLTSSYDAHKVQGTLGYEDEVLTQVFPAQKYDPENTPGLFS